jgi:monoterpene epsilon-lactone hydrolase
VLNTDAHRLMAKAGQEAVPLVFHEYEGMFHVWPIIPIPEARRAIGDIKALIWNTPPRSD